MCVCVYVSLFLCFLHELEIAPFRAINSIIFQPTWPVDAGTSHPNKYIFEASGCIAKKELGGLLTEEVWGHVAATDERAAGA